MRELGRGTIAIAVLGPTVIACSTDGTGGAIATASSVTAAASTSAEPTTTVPPTAESSDATEAPSTTSTDTATEEAPDLRWERVSLGFVSAYVLARGREVAIVDTGSPGSAGQIGEALVNLGANWDDVDHVILTHLHGDHVGGLGGVLDAAPEAIAYAGEADVSGISSSRPLRAVNDGDEVFGLQIIGTPGHTAGHISVLDVGAGFLVAGDALNESGGVILGPNPSFSSDLDEANRSVTKLAARDFDTVVFGHGEPFEGQASEAVVALAASLA